MQDRHSRRLEPAPPRRHRRSSVSADHSPSRSTRSADRGQGQVAPATNPLRGSVALAALCFRVGASVSDEPRHALVPDDTRSSGWTQSSRPLALRSQRVRPPGSSGVAVERFTTGGIQPQTGLTWRRRVRQPTKPRRFQARSDGSAPLLLPMSRTQGGSDRACRARRDGRRGVARERHRRCGQAGSRRRAGGVRAP
jgi:hypothetical protein